MEVDAIFRTEVENRKYTCHRRRKLEAAKDLPTMMAARSHVN
jgi:hypothetical protein